MRPPFAVAAAVLVLLLAGCGGPPSDVTGSAGRPTAPTSAVPPGDGAGTDADDVADLPPCPVAAPRQAPSGELPDAELGCLGPGAPLRLSQLPAVPAIINTWASWCGPCRSELPALASFSQGAGKEVLVLGLNVSDGSGAAAALWRELGMPFPSVTDPAGATRAELGWVGLPVTYFVAADGRIAGRHVGAVTTESEWADLAEQYLGAA